jgi:putative ABC transport system permease protein
LKPILFQPLSYPDPDRVVVIQEVGPNGSRVDGTYGMYRWMLERNRAFGQIAVVKSWQPTVTGIDEPERLVGERVTASYFSALGVQPAVGPGFSAADDIANGPNVVILSHAVWRRRFAANPAIVGRQITLDDSLYTVVGVMPAAFRNALSPTAELWSLLQYDMSQGPAWGHHLRTIGRLLPDIDVSEASRQTNDLGQAALAELRPQTYGTGVRFTVSSLAEEMTRGVRPMLLTIAVAVLLVLVIACANVTNLLLGRSVRRRGEFALRAALGAGGGRLLRQLLTESLLLGAIGGLAGLAVAWMGVRALVALSPRGLPQVEAIRVDEAVFLFSLGLTTMIGLLIGAIPAMQAARSDPQEFLNGSRVTPGGHRRTRRGLVVVEVAMALVLLVGAGLLFRSLQQLFAVPVGFDSSHLLTLQVQTTGSRFRAEGAAVQFFDELVERVRGIPGVVDVAFTSQLPLSGDRDEYGVRFEPHPDDSAPPSTNQGFNTFRYAVSPGYFGAMRLPIRHGRAFDTRDRDGAPLVAIVSESLARLKFGSSRDALGRHLQIGATDSAPYTVVGVAGDVKQMSLSLSEAQAVYTPARQWPGGDRTMVLVVRSNGDPLPLAAAVRQAIWAVDPNQPITRIETMDQLLKNTEGERRFALMLFAAFALAAVMLAAAGCYGVMASYVAERTREIGVRSVLGASRRAIVAQIVRQGVGLSGLGIVLGLVAAIGSSGALSTLLFGLTRLDPVAYVAAALLLLAVAAIASAIPAWRAARIDPVSTLKAE